MNERISTLGQEGLAEACYELEPHSPTTSQSSWSTENAGSSSGICKAPRRKGSQCRLRAWIAIDRNANRFISDEQRRACPMIGCEQRFPAPEYMHLHLKSCGSLSKGLYRCIETGVPVKVGKCDSDGCQELKGGFVSAVSSSFESVKRHLSGRRSKPKQASQLYLEKEFVPEESFPMETPWDANTAHQEPTPRDHEYLVETSPGIRGASMTNNELEAYAAPSELYSTPISTYRLTHPVHRELFTSLESYENNTTAGFEQGGFRDAITQDTRDVHYVLPVLQRHNNPPSHLAVHSEYQDLSESSLLETMLDQTGPAELCAGERPWGHPRPHATDSTWSLSSPVGRGDFGGFHTCSDIMAIPAWQHQHEHHPNQSTAPPLSFYYDSEKMVDDNISTHDADDLARLACNSLARSTRNDSASNSDPSVVPSMFSSFSSTSSGQSSLASYNSNPSSFDHTSFLGKDSMIFDEPESFESFPMSSSQEQAYRSDISSNARRSDTAGVSFDNYVKPGSYLSNPAMNK
ncbi:hypothetical protein BKA65DRAFT_144325 [Rhexocercosporidium sp. MPI-PUGE-AT-0058]|nr:hypothetical protein BKA65DRAFT_144325 [Rhexocercosporidium sp. MPI-PUGE-AT-0058]